MSIVIYHNPKCSKSRQTLQLLEEKGVTPEVVRYMDNPPSADTLRDLLGKLGMDSPRDLMRKKEDEYKQLGLAGADKSDDELLAAMCTHPRLIERPIVVNGNRAALGRPPENVLEIL